MSEDIEGPDADKLAAERERKLAACDGFEQVRETMPTGTPLSTMSPQDLKRELAERDERGVWHDGRQH